LTRWAFKGAGRAPDVPAELAWMLEKKTRSKKPNVSQLSGSEPKKEERAGKV